MKTIRRALSVTIAAMFVVALPATAHAQGKSRSEGFFVGGAYEGNAVAIEEYESTESGSGFGVTFGYGFTPNFALYGQWSGASIESEVDGDYDLRHFDVGTRPLSSASQDRRPVHSGWALFTNNALGSRSR